MLEILQTNFIHFGDEEILQNSKLVIVKRIKTEKPENKTNEKIRKIKSERIFTTIFDSDFRLRFYPKLALNANVLQLPEGRDF